MRRLLLPFALLPTLAQPLAAEPGAPDAEPAGRFSITLENDRLAADTDRHYSHGTRLSYLTGPRAVPAWLNALAGSLPLIDEGQELRLLFEAGQSLFTPEDLAAATPPPGERPYVGWLYAGVSALLESERTLDRVGLLLGVLGPAALAGSTQETVHRHFGMQHPEGWDSQPASRPGFVLLLDRFWRLVAAEPADGIQLELLPHAGLALGNVFAQAGAGLLLRLGSDLRAEPLPAAIAPGLAPGGAAEADDGGFRWSLFLDLAGRTVAHNLAVEGLEGEGPEALPLVADVTAGLTLSYGGVSVTYARTLRSPEAEGQEEPDAFGGLTISLDF